MGHGCDASAEMPRALDSPQQWQRAIGRAKNELPTFSDQKFAHELTTTVRLEFLEAVKTGSLIKDLALEMSSLS
jgi:hypothetical protein